jgi:glycine/D-amino acid oxidase-like deaminating enzyme
MGAKLNEKRVSIIGAGIYGLHAAEIFLKLGFNVEVFEKESEPMTGASLLNQARVHGGYHYPRAINTAARCQLNYERFVRENFSAIEANFVSIYAIAHDSRTPAHKFERFVNLIGAPIKKNRNGISKMFDSKYISATYEVVESAFNANTLRDLYMNKLSKLPIKFYFNCEVKQVTKSNKELGKELFILSTEGKHFSDYCINTTYGHFSTDNLRNTNFGYEVCEIISVEPPGKLKDHAVTIMDGPYWSLTPWPALESHVLTHVRHTPHGNYAQLELALNHLKNNSNVSRFEMMKRDASRFLPEMEDTNYISSKFVIKTIPNRRNFDDARPIMYRSSGNVLNVLGSKVDNIYELEFLIGNFLKGNINE